MRASAVVVSFNTRDLLARCLESLVADTPADMLELVVVDNASADGSADMVRARFPQARLAANAVNRGFAAAVNQGCALASGDCLVLMNPDAVVQGGAIPCALAFLERPENARVGLCGGRILNAEGRPEPSARRFPTAGRKLFTLSGLAARRPDSSWAADIPPGDAPRDVDWVPGTFSVIRGAMIREIGLFDERFFMYYEETDLCLRARRAGWRVVFLPGAEVVHVGGASSRARTDKRFDASGAQLREFRLRSEWLYHRKNRGLAGLAASAGVEMLWHGLRWLAHLRPGSGHAERRAASAQVLADIRDSLRDTRLGAFSPPAPW